MLRILYSRQRCTKLLGGESMGKSLILADLAYFPQSAQTVDTARIWAKVH